MAHPRIVLLSTLLSIGTLTTIVGTSCGPEKCSVVCINGGTCNDKQCICPVSHTGVNCEKTTILDNWLGNDNNITNSSTYQQQIAIARSTTDTTQILIGFSQGFAAGHVINGTLSADGAIVTYSKQLIPTSTTPDTVSGRIVLLTTTTVSNNYTYNNSHDGIIYSIQGNYSK
ncbi:hypothetical protein CJD36_007865 [Flavipsychrobacter stenotrophus]|uniref:EGF-like domain-containing protein n=1 Tax=Flavipsychrobacter stenotrophus TaxID=2077091 RepID=A0A2S7SYK2_9BACT|nr:hypothetical protein [Flavipsychrobacter stenotrophus]PQJ11701.1 hypothetical protein CJD36_007865 [Flavipsychrobacter stenotrophus]